MSAANRPDIDEAFALGTPIDEALNEAARIAIDQHRRAGAPLVVWRDGRVVWLDPHTMQPVEPGKSENEPRNS